MEAITSIHNFIMDKVYEKPDPNPKPVDGEVKVNLERHKQVGNSVLDVTLFQLLSTFFTEFWLVRCNENKQSTGLVSVIASESNTRFPRKI